MARHLRRAILTWLICCLTGALLLSGTAWADSSLDHDLQLWTPFYLTFPLKGKVKGYFEVNPRVGDDLSEMRQLLIRPAVGYQVTKALSLWQGYAWVADFLPTFRSENRLYQQLQYRTAVHGFNLLSRSRLEERFIEDTSGVAIRARTMLRVGYPFGRAKAWSVVLYDEVFINLNSIQNGPEGGFDQNRAFGGVNYKLSGHVNVDAGYQFQLVNSPEPGLANGGNHIILIQTFLNW